MTMVRTTLLPAEIASLRELGLGALKERISISRGEKLVRCGFANFQAGVLTITFMGRAKLALEITRANWFPGLA
jgi:hypothetical protein